MGRLGARGSNSCGRFMSAGGTMDGCESRVYSGAYAFFEREVWECMKKTGRGGSVRKRT